MASDETTNDNEPSKSSLSELLTEVDYDTTQEGWPYLTANFKYWAVSPFLTEVELACVSLGFDPGPLKVSGIDDLKSEPEMLIELSDRVRLTLRAVKAGDLNRQIRPADGVHWLEAIGQEVHPQFKNYVSKAPQIENAEFRPKSAEEIQGIIEIAHSLEKTRDAQAMVGTKSGITKKYHSIQKIALVGAIRGYGWNPKDKRSSVFREIADDAASLGIDIDQDTVRPHLRDAANDHLPNPEK